MDNVEQSAVIVEPKYYIRYFVYEDFTRQRVYYKFSFWASDKTIDRLKFGTTFEMQDFQPKELPIERLTVANRPMLTDMPHPDKEGITAQVLDVFFAPSEQWMLYKDASEEEIGRVPELINMAP